MEYHLWVFTSGHIRDKSEVSQNVSKCPHNKLDEWRCIAIITDFTHGNENRTSLMGDDPYIMSVETGWTSVG